MCQRLSRGRGIGHVSISICSVSRVRQPPDRRSILIATKAMLVTVQDTGSIFEGALIEE